MRGSFVVVAVFLSLVACGKSSSKNSGEIKDFTKYNLIQFKSSAGLGVSASRYDLTLADKTIKKYNFNSTTGYALAEEKTITEALKGTISGKLKKMSVNTLTACSAAACTAGRPSVWLEMTNENPDVFYFSNQGDCTCPADGANAPSLYYSQTDSIYQDILKQFAK
jgi:hypothetical protein